MRKIVSLILVVAMLASFATIAYAEEFNFTLTLLDSEQDLEVTEVNVGDTVYLITETDAKVQGFGYIMNIDTTAFSVAQIVDGEDVYDDFEADKHLTVLTVNPNGVENTMSITGAHDNRKYAISNTLGLVANKPGTYTISIKELVMDNMTDEEATLGAESNSVTIKVLGGEPEVPTADSIGLWTGGVAKLTNQPVKNSDGSEYEVKTGLAFLSCVKTEANATDLKTVITCADRKGELVIAAGEKVLEDADGYTYFGAAVTSIRDINLKKAFTAKAVATVGETVVTGNAVTATYDAE